MIGFRLARKLSYKWVTYEEEDTDMINIICVVSSTTFPVWNTHKLIPTLSLSLLTLHLVEDGQNHIKLGSLSGVLVHADSNQLVQVRRDSRWDLDAQALGRYLHAALHGRKVSERHFTGRQFPHADRETPHIASLPVAIVAFLQQRLWGQPRGLVQTSLLLERELGIAHVNACRQILVNLEGREES